MSEKLTGRCLCGAVVFSFPREDLKPADACHCSQCRRWSGFYWGSINAPADRLSFSSNSSLTWFEASDHARRGFCRTCGSSLFWQATKPKERSERIAIALGAIDGPTGIKIEEHIFVLDKGDYYDIADGVPQNGRE